jgi:hypothetical protein
MLRLSEPGDIIILCQNFVEKSLDLAEKMMAIQRGTQSVKRSAVKEAPGLEVGRNTESGRRAKDNQTRSVVLRNLPLSVMRLTYSQSTV